MDEEKYIDIKIETDFYDELGRMNVTVENAFKEFIDNSTTSFEDHRSELEQMGETKCKVHIRWDDDQIIIQDNAYGMNREEFGRAFKLNKKADFYSENSRSQYGLGLKYAAASLGEKCTIWSTALNSNMMYVATMDRKELKKTKAEQIPLKIEYADESKHGTKIVIEGLYQTFSQFVSGKRSQKLEKLRKELASVYLKDLKMNKLELVINDDPVRYTPPEYFRRPDTGAQVFEMFYDTFIFNGKEYSYTGKVGMLREGSFLGSTGLVIMQKDRGILTNYMPQALFGQSGSFKRLRVYGEIELKGDNWVVSFTKNGLKWSDNGLEDAFIESILSQEKVKKNVFDYADKYRKKEENVNMQSLRKMNLEGTFSSVDDNKTSNKKGGTKVFNAPTSKINVNKPDTIDNTEGQSKAPSMITKDEYVLPVSYGDNSYNFHIIPTDNAVMESKLFELKKNPTSDSDYDLYVNVRVPMFKNYTKPGEKEVLTKTAIALAVAQLSSVEIGINQKDVAIFINLINEVFNNCR